MKSCALPAHKLWLLSKFEHLQCFDSDTLLYLGAGIAKTKKRAVPTAAVSQIKHLNTANDAHEPNKLTSKQELARDAFLMSFYLRGISFIDLAHNSENTTQIYLRSIQSSEVDDANAKILASL